MKIKEKQKTLIIGSLGHLGRALYKTIRSKYEVLRHDVGVKKWNDGEEIHNTKPEEFQNGVVHICFPYSEDFTNIVCEYSKGFNPAVVIIHSTVKPGTTEKLNSSDVPAVHSPSLFDLKKYESLGIFKKLIGYEVPELALIAAEHLNLSFNTIPVEKAINTELAEILLGGILATNKAIMQDMERVFNAVKGNYQALRYILDIHNFGFYNLQKDSLLLPNFQSLLIENDYQMDNINLLPAELMSGFFKLANKSNEALKEMIRKNAEALVQNS